MSLDHPLGGEERLDLFAQMRNAVGLLDGQYENHAMENEVVAIEILTLIHSGRLAPKPRH